MKIKKKIPITINITKKELKKILPVIISDLKHAESMKRRIKNNKNIKRDLYLYVIRELFSKDRFNFQEKEDDKTERVGLYIKGYVRDIWDYLDSAYDLIHDNKWI
ncbi:MAG: hypothetical protein PHP92_03425 [Candidatus Nanoarchaeia archaeon]|nr:hypothetical protein [Candidatus Nanoarchaeia archaeon]